MALTNKLKVQVDLPVWEYCRFAPAATTNVSSLTTGNTLANRYLYYQVSNLLYRYDTYTDSWHQLQTVPSTTPTIMNCNVLSNAVGHYGQAIAGGANTIQLAGLSGNALVGYKIRILSGTGAGQERTITAVSAPIVAERGVITTASSTQVIDATAGVSLKQWKTNQWVNWQVRVDFGTGKTQIRPILYNTINTLTFTDPNYLTVNPWANCPMNPATAANGSLYVIESHQVTVDINWTVVPDASSNFVILSGGIWNISQGTTAAPFFSLLYYDLLSDVWYQKSTQSGLKTQVFLAASDLSMERITEIGGAIVKAMAVASATARSITTGSVMVAMNYANHELRIVSGTGIGQVRSILSNTTNKFNLYSDWDVIPDATSQVEIWRDAGKLWLIGGNDAGMLQYSAETDQWSTGKQLDYGQCNQLALKSRGDRPFSIASIARSATGITGLNPIPTVAGTGYNINDLLTITIGGTNGIARVTAVNSVGGVTAVSIEQNGTGYTVGAGKATTVVPAGGAGCTLEITAVDFTEVVTTPIVHKYKIGDSVTISGATGTGAAKFNGTYTVIGSSSNGLSFNYCSVGDPGAASATIPFGPSTTVLVDCTKNWAVNEHVGKLIQFCSNALLSTGQVRRIISNTATTITWTLAATAPVNGMSRYIIEDIKPFGTDRSSMGVIGGGTEGFATGGTTTTLVDNTKNWETNFWARTVNRKVRIVEGTGVGNEIAITSNTANTLTFATQAFAPDATTRYIIMDTFGTATAGALTTLTDASQNWGVNMWVNKRLRLLSGTGQGNEYIITSNTATVLTFASATAPDTSTAYAILEAPPKAYGIHLDMIVGSSDPTLNNRFMYAWSGTVSAEISRYNINTEHWEILSCFPQFETLTTGSMFCYDGKDRIYFWSGTPGRLMYYDLLLNIVVPSSTPPYGMSTVISGNRMEIIQTADGLKYLYLMRHSATEMWRVLLYW